MHLSTTQGMRFQIRKSPIVHTGYTNSEAKVEQGKGQPRSRSAAWEGPGLAIFHAALSLRGGSWPTPATQRSPPSCPRALGRGTFSLGLSLQLSGLCLWSPGGHTPSSPTMRIFLPSWGPAPCAPTWPCLSYSAPILWRPCLFLLATPSPRLYTLKDGFSSRSHTGHCSPDPLPSPLNIMCSSCLTAPSLTQLLRTNIMFSWKPPPILFQVPMHSLCPWGFTGWLVYVPIRLSTPQTAV